MKKIFAAFIIITSLASCKKSAFDYNQGLVDKLFKLTADVKEAEASLAPLLIAQKFDSVVSVSEAMEKKIDAETAEISSEPAPDANGSDKLKAAVTDYFNYNKNIYAGYKSLAQAGTQAAHEEEMKKLEALSAQRVEMAQRVQAAQLEYAKANNFSKAATIKEEAH